MSMTLFVSRFISGKAQAAHPQQTAHARIGRAARMVALMLVGAYPEPNARRMIGARRRSGISRRAG